MSNIRLFFKQLGFMMICAAVTNCADDSEVTASAPVSSGVAVEASDVINYSVTGSYTDFREGVDCKTCTFIVPADMPVVDGAKEKIGPGSVVCMQKGIVYKAIEFVNIDGTADSPVVIGVCNN